MADGRKLSVDIDEAAAGRVLARLSGELDVGSAQVFRDAVGPHGPSGNEIVLDISGLTFCDSTGLGALVAVYREPPVPERGCICAHRNRNWSRRWA